MKNGHMKCCLVQKQTSPIEQQMPQVLSLSTGRERGGKCVVQVPGTPEYGYGLHNTQHLSPPTSFLQLTPLVTLTRLGRGQPTQMTTTSAEWGAQLSQEALMLHDTVLVVDNADNVIGSASKKDSHIFDTSQPHGILHRAFSVFLFDESDGRLLLHQRSADKITFPNVGNCLINMGVGAGICLFP